jgi:hypothetical protein
METTPGTTTPTPPNGTARKADAAPATDPTPTPARKRADGLTDREVQAVARLRSMVRVAGQGISDEADRTKARAKVAARLLYEAVKDMDGTDTK